jgi:hypothetical protein
LAGSSFRRPNPCSGRHRSTTHILQLLCRHRRRIPAVSSTRCHK